MNAFSDESHQNNPDAAGFAPVSHGSLETMAYDELSDLLLGQNWKINRHPTPSASILHSLQNLTLETRSPRVIAFLWLCASSYLRNIKGETGSFSRARRQFRDYWEQHGKTIRRFLETAPLEFLSKNYKTLNDSMHHSNIIKSILTNRLEELGDTITPENAAHILRVYRGLRLLPPAHIIEQIKVKPIQTTKDLEDYISLLHGVSRAGISVTALGLPDPIKDLDKQRLKSLQTKHKNSLLWSLSAQFAFAQDAGTDSDQPLRTIFTNIHDHISNTHHGDHALRRTFNLASILLDRDQSYTNYNATDHMSQSEYKFMHDFREHGLTKAERANLKRSGIEKHVGNLDRDLDGHYMLGETPVIIEYDGQSHFRESVDGYGDEPNGSTKLQTHILRRIFPDHVIVRLHHDLGHAFTSLPEEQKADAYGKLRSIIIDLEPNAYYIDMHLNKLRVRSAQQVQTHHNEYLSGIESPKVA